MGVEITSGPSPNTYDGSGNYIGAQPEHARNALTLQERLCMVALPAFYTRGLPGYAGWPCACADQALARRGRARLAGALRVEPLEVVLP